MVELRVEFEILSNGQFVVERESLRHVADIQARLHVIRPHRLAEQLRGSAGGRKKTSQHFHGGRLAGAVRAEKAENLAALDTEAHVIHGREIAEFTGKSFGLDGRHILRAGGEQTHDHFSVAYALLLPQQGYEGRI